MGFIDIAIFPVRVRRTNCERSVLGGPNRGTITFNAPSWSLDIDFFTHTYGNTNTSRLYPASMAGHRCDVCRQRIKTEDSKAWRCKLCDFDLCRLCYEKKVRGILTGVLSYCNRGNFVFEPGFVDIKAHSFMSVGKSTFS